MNDRNSRCARTYRGAFTAFSRTPLRPDRAACETSGCRINHRRRDTARGINVSAANLTRARVFPAPAPAPARKIPIDNCFSETRGRRDFSRPRVIATTARGPHDRDGRPPAREPSKSGREDENGLITIIITRDAAK